MGLEWNPNNWSPTWLRDGAQPGFGKRLNLDLAKGSTWNRDRTQYGSCIEPMEPGTLMLDIGSWIQEAGQDAESQTQSIVLCHAVPEISVPCCADFFFPTESCRKRRAVLCLVPNLDGPFSFLSSSSTPIRFGFQSARFSLNPTHMCQVSRAP